MIHLLRKHSTPAMAVAIIALIAAIGGTATALPGKNTVTSDDIKSNAVTAAEIKKGAVMADELKKGAVTNSRIKDNAVRSSKVLNDSLTGDDIDESTLKGIGLIRRVYQKMNFGDDVELVSNGTVSVRARCVENGDIDGSTNADGVQLYARTTQSPAFMGGNDDRNGDSAGDGLDDSESLDPGDPIEDSTYVYTSFGTNPAAQSVQNRIDQGWVLGPDGSYIGNNSEALLMGVRTNGSNCLVVGSFELNNP